MAKCAKKSGNRKTAKSKSKINFEKFRLRSFVKELDKIGELEVHDKPVPLSQLSGLIEATDKAVLFKQVGPERLELVANVAGSRKRMAAAFGVGTDEVVEEYDRRVASPQPVVEVSASEAPVREVVWEGDDADLTKLPFHVQHEFDGSAYLSSGIDFTIDPETGDHQRRLPPVEPAQRQGGGH